MNLSSLRFCRAFAMGGVWHRKFGQNRGQVSFKTKTETRPQALNYRCLTPVFSKRSTKSAELKL